MEHADDLKPALEHANKRLIRRHPSSEFQIHHSTTPASRACFSRLLRIAFASRSHLSGAPRDECFHLARCPVGFQSLFTDPVNLALFVLVLDLPPALFHAAVGEL